MEAKIFVLYVGVQGMRSEDIEEFVYKLSTKIAPTSVEGEIIVIPTQSPNTTLECINPKYITDADLIKEHTEMLRKLKEHVQHQMDQIKEEDNE